MQAANCLTEILFIGGVFLIIQIMKISKVLSLSLVCFLASCANDQDTQSITDANVISISAEKDSNSRTTLESDAETVTWSENDRIYLFDQDGTSNGVFTLTSGVGQTMGSFNGTISGNLSDLNKSLYPVPAFENGVFSFDFPAVREYSRNSAAPMIGDFSTATKHVGFRNLVPLVRVSLVGENVVDGSVVTLTMNGQPITGTAVVDLESETLTIAAGGNELTVNGIPAGASYIDVPVPAGSYTGYSVKLNGEELKSSDQAGVLNKDDALVIGDLHQYIAFVNPNDQVDYAVFGNNYGVFYDFEEEANLPKRVAIYDGNELKPQLIVNYNEEGLPINISNENFVLVLGEHEGNTFNAFLIDKDGNSQIIENVELANGLTWDMYKSMMASVAGSRAIDYRTAVDVVNFGLSAVGCASSLGAAVGTGGWFIPLALINCSSALMDLGELIGMEIRPEVEIADGLLSHYVGWLHCAVDRSQCLDAALNDIMNIIDWIVDSNGDEIQLGNGAVISGIGDVKITLTWNKTSDIDLHCKTPEGAHIYYADRHPNGTNGWLDFDNIPGFPTCTDPENIFFEPAAAGQYDVYLHYYSDNNNNGPVNYKVVIFINGVGEVFEGTINHVNDIVPIKTFVMGAASRAAVPFRAITWDWNNLPAKN